MSGKAKLKTVIVTPFVLGLVVWLIIPWQEIGEAMEPVVVAFRWTLIVAIAVLVGLGSLRYVQARRTRQAERYQEAPMIVERSGLLERWRQSRQQGGDDA